MADVFSRLWHLPGLLKKPSKQEFFLVAPPPPPPPPPSPLRVSDNDHVFPSIPAYTSIAVPILSLSSYSSPNATATKKKI
jgi:hypothetical protein